eukprot:1715133-Rhodomonas_salina.1
MDIPRMACEFSSTTTRLGQKTIHMYGMRRHSIVENRKMTKTQSLQKGNVNHSSSSVNIVTMKPVQFGFRDNMFEHSFVSPVAVG